ncbi:MAG: pyruvate:ferredoxin (flavodoxin) oxidoreductase [Oscillospiraceae bacterium]|jgi:pyruvate-ferredoxin/flavodoxin oxidoreductase|nr:pyruvate:ferredoxin (flavodoxin) oxidoreductase [Oscillospiraceae bacterium]
MARKMKTMDGNTAAAHVSYAYTDVAAIYPITPSSVMAEEVDKWSAGGRKNIFGQEVRVVEMQSEAGAAGAVHGSLAAGALTTTFTASQGLLLMIPNMYKMAGENLPAVIQVSARALASHALSIFGDHSDIYACRQTGFAMLASSSVQEVMDLSAVAHLAAIKGRVPFMHFFDGFRTSHEVDKIEVWDYEDLAGMLDMNAVNAYRKNALNPNHPVQRGTAQNPDVFFQAREASNVFYDRLPAVVDEYFAKVNEKLGTDYASFNYYGAPDAEHVIIAMGSVCGTIEESVDYLAKQGVKVGLVKVRLYRPFCADKLLAAIPDSAKSISVLDRTKEPGALGEPLYLDVALALRGSKFKDTPLYAGRYGLGSKDTQPADILAVYKNAKTGEKPHFTLSINDDVTHLSLTPDENPDTAPEGTTSCKFWGLGADGTVGANKNSIKIIGDHTDMYAQAYFAYDSKKSGGVTISHLRFGKSPIKSTYFVNKADFVACHNPSYVTKYKMVEDLKAGGSFLLNCPWDDAELDSRLPGSVKRYIANNNIKFYTIDAISIGRELGLGGRVNTVLQAAFFKIAGIIPIGDAVKYMKDAASKSYGAKGDAIVKMNHDAIDRGLSGVREVTVPSSWKSAEGDLALPVAQGSNKELTDYVNSILIPVNAQMGESLPVSAFAGREDGTFPMGSAAYEKRGIAVDIPCWQTENCIQCNFCSYVCPHAVIRPFLLTEEEAKAAPAGTKLVDATGLPGLKFAMTVSALDCTGCGSCVNVCPGKKGEKALALKPLESQLEQQNVFAYCYDLPEKPEAFEKFKATTVKGSQFKQPLLEYSGACAGCGETPYAKLITQLFGERMYIANATGCSSIWGGSAPSTPYTVNSCGKGPAWANSLFEDNAEYGYGMYLAQKAIREKLKAKTQALIAIEWVAPELKAAAEKWLSTYSDGELNAQAAKEYAKELEDGVMPVEEAMTFLSKKTGEKFELALNLMKNLQAAGETTCNCEACSLAKEILSEKDYLGKKSVWIFGGDGWAYDIGFGGLDHVIASGEDVNIFVFDTEVYSNTGGQSSKSTPTGAVAQFAAAGKEVKKKDLAAIAMSYGYVYVAQVGQGSDYNQLIKAVAEAESYKGPSIVIAYAPCINHGIKGGMSGSQTRIKEAVAAGYWHLFRFDPRRSLEGLNPFQLDSKAPTADYKEFLGKEVRYTSLQRAFPDRATTLFDRADQIAREKYEHLMRLSKLYDVE